MTVLNKLRELDAAASPGPWIAAVLSTGDGSGQVMISDAKNAPVFFVVDQSPDNAQLAALSHLLLPTAEALDKLLNWVNRNYGVDAIGSHLDARAALDKLGEALK